MTVFEAYRHTTSSFRAKKALGYVCAVLCAWLSVNVTMRFHALHGTPLALSFAAVAAITTYFGLGPGIAGVISTATFVYFHVLLPGSASPLSPGIVSRTLILLGVGFLIAFFCERQRVIGMKLRENAETLTQAQQGSRSAAWVLSRSDWSMRWAGGGYEIFGRPLVEVTDLESFLAHIDPLDRSAVQQQLVAEARASMVHAEFRHTSDGGERQWIEVRGTLSDDGTTWRGVVMDITDRKGIELALLRSEKLAAIGRLSSTVAHEINNPLEALTNLLYLAASDASLSPATRHFLDEAEQELKRLASIARHTLSFARRSLPDEPADVTAVASSVVAMFQPKCRTRGGEIRLVPSAKAYTTVPSDELRQILANLLSNACDAVPDTTGLVQVALSPDEDSLTVTVSDNGTGISPGNLDRIFDAFFTTKDDVGTGIGLWVTKELVEKHGGQITVLSGNRAAPFSTVFAVHLPRVAAPDGSDPLREASEISNSR